MTTTGVADLTDWVNQAGDDPSQWCFLVGAGISKRAGLPIASGFVGALIDCVSPSEEDKPKLRNFAGISASPEDILCLVEDQKYLRFEAFMACIRRYTEETQYRDLLKCYTDAAPTRPHWLLATLLDAPPGTTVFTTNFDSLIEECRVESNRDLTWITGDEHSRNHTGLFKLHGTVARWSNGNKLPMDQLQPEDLPAATLDDLGRVRWMAKTQNRFLEALSSASIVIVAGYSAGDVFDVTAWLRGIKPKSLSWRLLWIDHSEDKAIEALNGQDILESKKRSLPIETVRNIAEAIRRNGGYPDDQVRFVHANTDVIWEKVIAPRFTVCLDAFPETGTSPWESKLMEWNRSLTETQRSLITAAAYFEAAQYGDAQRILESLSQSPHRNSLLAQILRIKEGEPWTRALSLAEDLIKHRDEIWQHKGLLIKAKVLQQRRRPENRLEALRCIDRVLANAFGLERAEALFVKAQLHRDAVEHEKAASTALEAYQAACPEGNLRMEAEALHERAKIVDRTAKRSEDILQALESLDEAITIRRQLIRLKDLVNGLNVRGIMLQHLSDSLFMEADFLIESGRELEAQEKLQEAQERLKEASRFIDDAWEKANILRGQFELTEVQLNRAWWFLKVGQTNEALAIVSELDQLARNELARQPDQYKKKEHGKRNVLRGAVELMNNNRQSARGFFHQASECEDKICKAAGKAGLALCEQDQAQRDQQLYEAAKMFEEEAEYYRGQKKCHRLLGREPSNIHAWEIPDALL